MFIGGNEKRIFSDLNLFEEIFDEYFQWNRNEIDRSNGIENISQRQKSSDEFEKKSPISILKSTIFSQINENSSRIPLKNSSLNSNSIECEEKSCRKIFESSSRISKEIRSNLCLNHFPQQIYRKALKKVFQFNLIVVGQSGLGKSTFINELFQNSIYNDEEYPNISQRTNQEKTLQINSTTILIKEKQIQLRLTLIDTPGFGDSIDNSNCWEPLIDLIQMKNAEYFLNENQIDRNEHFIDGRIHCCLYFLNPTGHNLHRLDLEVLKHLSELVNLIPIIAKADSLTKDELILFKKKILQEILTENIEIYSENNFPSRNFPLNEEFYLQQRIPFAIVSSNSRIQYEEKQIPIRKYPWGSIQIENENHCDFRHFKEFLFKRNLNDFCLRTNQFFYENYRQHILSNLLRQYREKFRLNFDENLFIQTKNLFSLIEEQKQENENRLKSISEQIHFLYQTKLNEKLQQIQINQQNLIKTEENCRQQLEEQQRKYEEKKEEFQRMKENYQKNSQRNCSQTKSIQRLLF